jgi:putative membrane protein
MPVLAQSVGEKTGVNSVIGITPSTQDFVTKAAQSDMFEIQSSKLALGSADSATKGFAQKDR